MKITIVKTHNATNLKFEITVMEWEDQSNNSLSISHMHAPPGIKHVITFSEVLQKIMPHFGEKKDIFHTLQQEVYSDSSQLKY